jgi:hypothetical protein
MPETPTIRQNAFEINTDLKNDSVNVSIRNGIILQIGTLLANTPTNVKGSTILKKLGYDLLQSNQALYNHKRSKES